MVLNYPNDVQRGGLIACACTAEMKSKMHVMYSNRRTKKENTFSLVGIITADDVIISKDVATKLILILFEENTDVAPINFTKQYNPTAKCHVQAKSECELTQFR